VWTITYRFDGFHTTDPAYTYITAELDYTTNATAVGNSPIAIVLNEDKTIAFVLNEADATVSALRLSATAVTSVATYNLADTLSGKSVSITPNSITFYANEDTESQYLLVGGSGILGYLVVDVTPATVAPASLPLSAVPMHASPMVRPEGVVIVR